MQSFCPMTQEDGPHDLHTRVRPFFQFTLEFVAASSMASSRPAKKVFFSSSTLPFFPLICGRVSCRVRSLLGDHSCASGSTSLLECRQAKVSPDALFCRQRTVKWYLQLCRASSTETTYINIKSLWQERAITRGFRMLIYLVEYIKFNRYNCSRTFLTKREIPIFEVCNAKIKTSIYLIRALKCYNDIASMFEPNSKQSWALTLFYKPRTPTGGDTYVAGLQLNLHSFLESV